MLPAVEHAIRLASHDRFGVVQFSVQSNHLHLIVEAKSRGAYLVEQGARELLAAGAASTTVAIPWPTPMHIAASP